MGLLTIPSDLCGRHGQAAYLSHKVQTPRSSTSVTRPIAIIQGAKAFQNEAPWYDTRGAAGSGRESKPNNP